MPDDPSRPGDVSPLAGERYSHRDNATLDAS